jgi:hypothetical protein
MRNKTSGGLHLEVMSKPCTMCQAIKTSNQRLQGLLHSLPIPTTPWSSIGMDFVGPFPLADDLDYIWVVLCCLTLLVHLIPLHTTTTAAQLVPLFMSHIVRLHGLPETIVSERDSKFMSQFWTKTHRPLGIKLMKSTTFHLQMNSAIEIPGILQGTRKFRKRLVCTADAIFGGLSRHKKNIF